MSIFRFSYFPFITAGMLLWSLSFLGCTKKETINKKEDVVGKWDMTEYNFKIYENDVLTIAYKTDKADLGGYLGYMELKEEGRYKSDISHQILEAFFLYGYSDNAVQSSYTQGIWQLSDNKKRIHFDSGVPELLVNMGENGHTLSYTVTGDSLVFSATTEEAIAYYGYYNGKFSNTPPFLSPNSSTVQLVANAQATPYAKGVQVGYYYGFYTGLSDRLEELGAQYKEAYHYGLANGTKDDIQTFSKTLESDANYVNGYNSKFNTGLTAGKTYADSIASSPAKKFDLKYSFSKE
jgi:hypothetical protein